MKKLTLAQMEVLLSVIQHAHAHGYRRRDELVRAEDKLVDGVQQKRNAQRKARERKEQEDERIQSTTTRNSD